MLYFFLFILHLNVLRVPGYYLTLCPWVAADFLFNSVRWQEVRDCAEPLSNTVNRGALRLHLTPFSVPLHSDCD